MQARGASGGKRHSEARARSPTRSRRRTSFVSSVCEEHLPARCGEVALAVQRLPCSWPAVKHLLANGGHTGWRSQASERLERCFVGEAERDGGRHSCCVPESACRGAAVRRVLTVNNACCVFFSAETQGSYADTLEEYAQEMWTGGLVGDALGGGLPYGVSPSRRRRSICRPSTRARAVF